MGKLEILKLVKISFVFNCKDYWNATGEDVEKTDMTMEHLQKLTSLNDAICLIFHDVDMIPVSFHESLI